MTATIQIRPSDERRARLKEADAELGNGRGVPLVSNFFPIERYYDAADKLLQAFHQAYNTRDLDWSYQLGKRFATFSINSLPEHNYYKLPKNASWRKQNQKDMDDVIQKLEQIAQWMDDEERQKQKLQAKRLADQQRQIQEQKAKEFQKMKEIEAKIHSKRQNMNNNNKPEVVHSALDKLSLLNQRYNQPPQSQQERPGQQRQDSSAPSLSTASSSSISQQQQIGGSSHSSIGGVDLPPPLPPPVLPPCADGAILPPIPPPQMPTSPTHSTSSSSASNGGALPPPPSYNQISSLQQQQPQQQQQSLSTAFKLEGKSSTLSDDQVSSLFSAIKRESENRSLTHIGAPAGGAIIRPPPPPPIGGSNDQGSFLRDVSVGDRRQQQQQQQQQRPQYQLQQQPKQKVKQSIGQLRAHFVYNYNQAFNANKIVKNSLSTYQGRLPGSTNACTVISPLMVANHLKSHLISPPSPTITDSTISDVIDKQCIPIVRDIRSKLQLDGHALIIPSDVHDYMVDHKILSQEKFVGASGGNILDKSHIGEFLKLLAMGEQNTNNHLYKKSGGVLFFREHVISVVKVPIGNKQFVYDLIDSLPTHYGKASRTRCTCINSLFILLQHYALSKFSDSNCNYIDNNEWDDNMADFDPRVFQGFVWADLPPSPTQ